VVLIDDSIVRGTTSRHIVALLKEAGAKEVHFRVSSPPIRFPCYYGIDTAARKELIAAEKSVEEIRAFIGADTLAFLSEEGVKRAIGGPVCLACFNGHYPAGVPVEGEKQDPQTKVAPPAKAKVACSWPLWDPCRGASHDGYLTEPGGH